MLSIVGILQVIWVIVGINRVGRHLHEQGKIHTADDAGQKGWCAGLVLLVLHSGYARSLFEIIVDASGDASPEIVFLVIQVPALPHSFFIKVTQRSKVLDGFRAA